MNFATMLRLELAERARRYAELHGLPYCLSYGESPSVCFAPSEQDARHGNFLLASYKAILASPEWRRSGSGWLSPHPGRSGT